MSVFLRWGIFGILGTAAVVYAYNVAKDMNERREARAALAPAAPGPAAAEPETRESNVATEPAAKAAPVATAAPHCEAELVVAQLALDARRTAEPLDRLLRIQEIAWQEPRARRVRLEEVATRWYQLEGDDPIPEALRISVISDCEHFSPAP